MGAESNNLRRSSLGDDSPDHLKQIVKEILLTSVEPDGLTFNVDSISISEIRDDQEYTGQRIKFDVLLGKARIPLQIDIAYGDVVTPHDKVQEYPSLLGMPKPIIRVYPRETVVAEKLQAMVHLGIQNSRMKDFYDLLWLSKIFDFDGQILRRAIRATFQRRRTGIPPRLPLALSDEFAKDQVKEAQWGAFLKRSGVLSVPEDLSVVILKLRDFLEAPLNASRAAIPFERTWSAGGTWR